MILKYIEFIIKHSKLHISNFIFFLHSVFPFISGLNEKSRSLWNSVRMHMQKIFPNYTAYNSVYIKLFSVFMKLSTNWRGIWTMVRIFEMLSVLWWWISKPYKKMWQPSSSKWWYRLCWEQDWNTWMFYQAMSCKWWIWEMVSVFNLQCILWRRCSVQRKKLWLSSP